VRKDSVLGRPSLIAATLGGAAGGVLAGTILELAPAVGAPALHMPLLVGGMLSATPETAVWAGWLLLLVAGWLVVPGLLIAIWATLPGAPESVGGALLKGAAAGVGVWIVVGLTLPVIAGVSRVDAAGATGAPGLFGLGAGGGGAMALLIASLGYGLVLGAIASMSRGLAPLNTLGWGGHGAGRAA
jgi:hypothetical protein